jgi:hypothetical protein
MVVLMRTERTFRTVNVPIQIFNHCITCLEEMMGITVTKKEILKDEGDDFDALIEGTRTSSSGQLIIRLKLHGWRDYGWHAGFWPSAETTDVTIETFEIKDTEELLDTPNARKLNEEFNWLIGRYYLWHTSG